MNYRITTNMMMNTYNYNLMQSTNQLNNASEKVQSGRNFSSYSEDPTSATLAFNLRRDLWRNNNQLTNLEYTTSKVQVAWTAAGTCVDKYGIEAKSAIVAAVSDTAGAGRESYGITLKATAESMVNTLNAKYGEHFVFNGNDCMNAPFAWNETTGNLEYRGVNINAPTGSADYYKLLEMSGDYEKNFVDVGNGLSYTESGINGELIDSTAFNNAFCGLDLTGFGTDEDGDPLCMISLVNELGELFSSCDANTGEYPLEGDAEKAQRLMDKYEAALSKSIGYYSELDVKQDFLFAQEDRLIDVQDNLNEQISSLEDVDPAEAITQMSYQQYCYSSALKIGTQILSQSLLDYM